MRYLITIALTLPTLLLVNCDYGYNPNDFTFINKPYLGDELRIDGYYYSVSKSTSRSVYKWEFLYRNGIYRNGGASNDSLYFQEVGWLDDEGKIIWGYFEIIGDSILIEKWTPEGTYIYSGNIPNDTTYVITQTQRYNGKEKREVNIVYHFIEYSPKPDGVSRFID